VRPLRQTGDRGGDLCKGVLRLTQTNPGVRPDFVVIGEPTNWAGKAGIPSIGFGLGDEKTAHMIDERVPLQEVVDATQFYALLPYLLKNNL
jgi:acetylornithine deacetylase/succinyl-diaminopimelate desuccinylase-like protein